MAIVLLHRLLIMATCVDERQTHRIQTVDAANTRSKMLNARFGLHGQRGPESVAPHDLRRTCARLCHQAGGELEQIQFLLGHVSVQTTERYLGCKQRFRDAVNDHIGLEPYASSRSALRGNRNRLPTSQD
jgi:integrase